MLTVLLCRFVVLVSCIVTQRYSDQIRYNMVVSSTVLKHAYVVERPAALTSLSPHAWDGKDALTSRTLGGVIDLASFRAGNLPVLESSAFGRKE